MQNKVYFDLHIHSCLSPCGDDDMTPGNIIGMSSLKGLHVVALCDHNTCKNCPAFISQAEKQGVVGIAGIELTTSEDIHVIALFEELSDAMRFDEFLTNKRTLFKNEPDVFGHQYVVDENDEIVSEEEYLLINSVDISVDDVYDLLKSFRAVAFPAHIDKVSNGIVGVLGTVPENSFTAFEFSNIENVDDYLLKFENIKSSVYISNSDAHYLWDISEAENYFLTTADIDDKDTIKHELFKYLRGEMSEGIIT